MRSVRRRAALVALCAGLAGLPGLAPAHALVPSVCSVVASPATLALVADSPAARRLVRAAGGTVVGGIAAVHTVEAAFPSRGARDAAVRALGTAGLPAQPEHTYSTLRSPTDPYYRQQWGLTKVGAPRGWDHETGTSSKVTVAVLDTGADLTHPDLAGHVSAGKDVVNDDDDPSDDNGHGTHVSGIIAAATNNGVGVAGLSWGATVLAVKVMDGTGRGSDCDIALGMVLAVRAGARVLNLSLGADGVDCGAITQQVLDWAHDQGALAVIASGNSAKKGNPISAPADCAGVLTVGATDIADRVAPFSSHHDYVAVSAPGVSVLSTYVDPKTHKHVYAFANGTSMATPFVAGLAALLFSAHSGWTPDQVRTRITTTADDLGTRGKDEFYGAGRINVARALS